MSTLLIIPEEFAIGMIGQMNVDSVFNYRVANSGQYVCDPVEMTLFPDNFAKLETTGWTVVTVRLSGSDFPPDPPLF
jgi:hypothetical protein